MQTPAGLMRYHANACGLDALSCKRLRAWFVIMQTPVGLICYHANACGLDVCYHANDCGLDVLACERLWV